jgi:hypothetical protein
MFGFGEQPSCVLASAGKDREFHVFMASCTETTRHGTMNKTESKMGFVDVLTINPSVGVDVKEQSPEGVGGHGADLDRLRPALLHLP